MNFPIQSNPQAAFLCDKNWLLFVTVVQSEGIFIRFPGPPSRFTFNNCYSGTAIQSGGTVADHRRPDAVSCPKCTRSTSEMGDPEQFHKGSCPKGVLFRHGTDSILHCRPQVSSQKKDTCCGVEGAVHFCRTSIRNSGFMPKDNRGVERIIKIFPHLLFNCESRFYADPQLGRCVHHKQCFRGQDMRILSLKF